jgi:hypothetical protein
LLGRLSSALKPLAEAPTKAADSAGTAEINELLELDHPGSPDDLARKMHYICEPSGPAGAASTRRTLEAKGEDSMLLAQLGKSNAQAFAGCARLAAADLMPQRGGFGSRPTPMAPLSFAEWVGLTGANLARYALYMDGDTEEQRRSAQRARAYLDFAANQGVPAGPLKAQLEEKYFARARPATGPMPAAVVTGSAESLVARYQENKFSFKRQHNGKMIQVTGKVDTISSDGMNISILAAPKVAPDNRGFQHFVHCKLADEAAADKVASLREGKAATVRGVFAPDERVAGLMTGLFTLKGCQIQP